MATLFASYEFYVGNYFRPLDWRLAAAERLAAARPRRRPALPIDPAVARLTTVLKAEARPPGSRRAVEPDADRVAWREAVALRDAGGPARAEVEARLLAGQTDAEIAARCGLSPGAVGWFEAAVFHVRDRLAARDWVVGRVIGTSFPPGDPGPVLRYFGYHGGPGLLDVALAVLSGRPLPPEVTAAFAADPAYEDRRLRFLVELHVAALRATTFAGLAALVDVYEEARRVDRERVDVRPALRSDLRAHRAILAAAAARPAGTAKGGRRRPTRASAGVPRAEPVRATV